MEAAQSSRTETCCTFTENYINLRFGKWDILAILKSYFRKNIGSKAVGIFRISSVFLLETVDIDGRCTFVLVPVQSYLYERVWG